MHGHVGDVIQRVLFATRPDIAILVAVAFQAPVDACAQGEASEIELALMD